MFCVGLLQVDALTGDSDWLMELSTQSVDELTAVEANIESTLQRLYHLRRHRNSLASPLLRLPTELILIIFERAIEPDDKNDDYSDEIDFYCSYDDGDVCNNSDNSSDSLLPKQDFSLLLVLVGVCHQLREIGITTPRLWTTINLAVPSPAELFLKRCNYNPRVIVIPHDRDEEVWVKLEGCKFNGLRSLFFKGVSVGSRDIGATILEGAANLSSLDVQAVGTSVKPLPWDPDAPMPHLSVLRLRGYSISWTSPLLRDLTRLTLDLKGYRNPPGPTPIETFLAALANCPDLELLELSSTGLGPPSGQRDNCDVIVQLRRLWRLSLNFKSISTIGYILSHIGYPESARVKLFVWSLWDYRRKPHNPSQVIPYNTDTFQHLRGSRALTFLFGDGISAFSADKFSLCIDEGGYSAELLRLSSEAVRRDTVISLSLRTFSFPLDYDDWGTLLCGFPRLERIKYHLSRGFPGHTDPFISVFSQPSEGGPAWPELQYLELSREVLISKSSARLLERSLEKRKAHGAWLMRIGFFGKETEEDDTLEFVPPRNLFDEVTSHPQR